MMMSFMPSHSAALLWPAARSQTAISYEQAATATNGAHWPCFHPAPSHAHHQGMWMRARPSVRSQQQRPNQVDTHHLHPARRQLWDRSDGIHTQNWTLLSA